MILDALLSVGGKLIDKLIPDPAAKAQAQLELAKLAQTGELTAMANETELYRLEQGNVTDRHKSDMNSDSWLSKNIRPATLIFIMSAFFIFAIMSACGVGVDEQYNSILSQIFMLSLSFYFGGRTIEKLAESKKK